MRNSELETVLVTGHRGYIGALLVPALLEAGFRVVGMDCGFYENSTFFGALAEVEEISKDIRLAEAEDFRGIDTVIHLAALSNDPTGDLDAAATDSINRAGTVHLASLAKSEGVKRFLFMSSCSLYGESGEEPVDESSPSTPLTPYGHSKIDAERELAELNDEVFSVTCLRGGTAYGASPRLRMDLLINDIVSSAVCADRIELITDGMAWRPFVHIGDFVDAAIAIMRSPTSLVCGQSFNIGRSDQNFQVLEIARMVQERVPSASLVHDEGLRHDARSYRVNFDKLHRHIPGIEIGWTIERGLADLESVCRQRLEAIGSWHRDEFSRVVRLKELIDSKSIDLNDPVSVTWFARNKLKSA